MASKPSASLRSYSGPPFSPIARKTLKEAWGLFVFSAIFALLFDLFYAYGIELKVPPVKKSGIQGMVQAAPSPEVPGWTKTPSQKPSPTPLPYKGDNFQRLSLMGVKDRFDKGSCVFLDARKPEEYTEGHIPGALNLYGNELEKYVPLVVPQLRDKDQEIVAYCHGGDCDLSLQVAKALTEAGYTKAKIFEGGWPDWKKAGYPTTKGETP